MPPYQHPRLVDYLGEQWLKPPPGPPPPPTNFPLLTGGPMASNTMDHRSLGANSPLLASSSGNTSMGELPALFA